MDETRELYDKISRILTDYENPMDLPKGERIQAEDLYEVLVEVQNWMADNGYDN